MKTRVRKINSDEKMLYNELSAWIKLLDSNPDGIFSVVSDTFQYWEVLSQILPILKDQIMNRHGKVVIRPDTGDPYRIICGYKITVTNKTASDIINRSKTQSGYIQLWENAECYHTIDHKYVTRDGEITQLEAIGSINVLYNTFGGTVNSKGYVELDSHIGLIYGDSITYDRCVRICESLKEDGFASTNVVFGVGSYTYQYNTRDTFGLACKATWVQINGQPKNIFKDPKTGDGMKKSARGLLLVERRDNNYNLVQEVPVGEDGGCLTTVFKNGVLVRETKLSEIRERLNSAN